VDAEQTDEITLEALASQLEELHRWTVEPYPY
jgi:hypothetical protein